MMIMTMTMTMTMMMLQDGKSSGIEVEELIA